MLPPSAPPDALGAEVAPQPFEAGRRYLRDHEWARNADDKPWRRSKLGLPLDAAARDGLARWWDDH